MIRRWLIRLGACVLALLLALGLLELGLRLVWLKHLTIAAGEFDPHFHHRFPPHSTQRYVASEFDVTIHTNQFGLRGPEPVLPKSAGQVRILMLGDSYTFGYYVREEETFCQLIGEQLAAQGLPVDVVNGGVPSYSPTLHYISLRDQFLQFEPDLVVLWYDLGDLQDDYRHQRHLVYDRDGRIIRCDPRLTHGRFDTWAWIKSHTAIGQYLEMKVMNLVDRLRVLGLGGYLKAKREGIRTALVATRVRLARRSPDLLDHERFLFLREEATDEVIASYWPVSEQFLSKIHQLLTERQIPLVIGIYPYGMLVGPDHWAEGRTYWGFEQGRTYDASKFIAVLQRFCQAKNLPLIDTFDSFRQARNSEPLFYNLDGHFTPAGNRVLASHVVRDPQFMKLVRQLVADLR